MIYEELIKKIGPGFHPDTPGSEYESLPKGVTPKKVDKIIDQAWLDWETVNVSSDPYDRALDFMVQQGWTKTNKLGMYNLTETW